MKWKRLTDIQSLDMMIQDPQDVPEDIITNLKFMPICETCKWWNGIENKCINNGKRTNNCWTNPFKRVIK